MALVNNIYIIMYVQFFSPTNHQKLWCISQIHFTFTFCMHISFQLIQTDFTITSGFTTSKKLKVNCGHSSYYIIKILPYIIDTPYVIIFFFRDHINLLMYTRIQLSTSSNVKQNLLYKRNKVNRTSKPSLGPIYKR